MNKKIKKLRKYWKLREFFLSNWEKNSKKWSVWEFHFHYFKLFFTIFNVYHMFDMQMYNKTNDFLKHWKKKNENWKAKNWSKENKNGKKSKIFSFEIEIKGKKHKGV